MAKVYFVVRTTTDDEKKNVSIRIRYKDRKIDQSTATGESVQLQHWDLDKQNFKRTSFKGKDNLISRLKKLELHVIDQAIKANSIDSGWLYSVVDKYRFPKKYELKDSQYMLSWINNWIERSEKGYSTLKAYHSTLKDLKNFNSTLTWNDLTMPFYYDFIDYLNKKGLSKNTISSRIKNLKVFCQAAYERKLHNNDSFRNFKKQTEESFNIYLNEEELNSIFKLELSRKPSLDRVRDYFLVGCWTGGRFSDLNKVVKENIDGQFIRYEQQKSKKRVVIPLHPVVKSIITKYDSNLPSNISNQKFNDYIKEVCKIAEINGSISKSITKGGKRETEVKEKWEMVSSHTARRSFATNLYKSGFPSLGIMSITGHKTEKAFLTYIKVNEEEHAEMLAKHWKNFNL